MLSRRAPLLLRRAAAVAPRCCCCAALLLSRRVGRGAPVSRRPPALLLSRRVGRNAPVSRRPPRIVGCDARDSLDARGSDKQCQGPRRSLKRSPRSSHPRCAGRAAPLLLRRAAAVTPSRAQRARIEAGATPRYAALRAATRGDNRGGSVWTPEARAISSCGRLLGVTTEAGATPLDTPPCGRLLGVTTEAGATPRYAALRAATRGDNRSGCDPSIRRPAGGYSG